MQTATRSSDWSCNQREFWSGVMFTVIGAGFAAGALNYKLGKSAEPGPGYFPLGLGLILAALGMAVLLRSFSRGQGDGQGRIGKVAWRPLAVVVLAVLMFGFAMPRLGLMVTMPLLVFITSLAGDEFRWREAALTAVVMTAASWLVFVVGLSMTLPVWPQLASMGG